MGFETIGLETEGGTATITLRRPEAMNAITTTMLEELRTALVSVGGDAEVGVVVLTGEGRAFSAGVDIKALAGQPLENGSVGGTLNETAREVIKLIQDLPKVVIAKINGFCFTGALELALACDLTIASEDAKLGDTHAKWGLRPTWGMSQRLPRAVGMLKAKELSFTADAITGRDAEAMGLINRAVPRDQLDEAVQTLAEKILANSAESIAAYKVLFHEGAGKTLEEGLAFEENTEFPISDTNERLGEFLKKG